MIGKVDRVSRETEIISGEYLLGREEAQAVSLGVEMLEEEVISIEKKDFFEVITGSNKFITKAVLIATGQIDKKLEIDSLSDFVGRGVSYCTSCDGFFYNDLKVGVIGFKDYAIYEAIELMAYTKDITIFTNGRNLEITDNFKQYEKTFKINYKPVKGLEGNDFLEKIVFSDDISEAIDGVFIAYDSAGTSDFANQLGVVTNGKFISVDINQQTNIKGVFAAGDCTGDQGDVAGKGIIEYVRSISKK